MPIQSTLGHCKEHTYYMCEGLGFGVWGLGFGGLRLGSENAKGQQSLPLTPTLHPEP